MDFTTTPGTNRKNYLDSWPDWLNDGEEKWLEAVCAFDYGDPRSLSDLVDSEREIPAALRPAIAAMLRGERKPNMRAAAKSKIPPAERFKIGLGVVFIQSLCDTIRGGAAEIADRKYKEPIEVIRELEQEAREFIEQTASEYGVSVEAVEVVVRDTRKRIERYPVV